MPTGSLQEVISKCTEDCSKEGTSDLIQEVLKLPSDANLRLMQAILGLSENQLEDCIRARNEELNIDTLSFELSNEARRQAELEYETRRQALAAYDLALVEFDSKPEDIAANVRNVLTAALCAEKAGGYRHEMSELLGLVCSTLRLQRLSEVPRKESPTKKCLNAILDLEKRGYQGPPYQQPAVTQFLTALFGTNQHMSFALEYLLTNCSAEPKLLNKAAKVLVTAKSAAVAKNATPRKKLGTWRDVFPQAAE